MTDVLCCDDCFALICKKSTKSARFWLELCALKDENGIFGLRTNQLEEIRTLEVMGFIMTTEILTEANKEILVVKVNGEKQNYFCRGNCDE